jgi:hypothetical protein
MERDGEFLQQRRKRFPAAPLLKCAGYAEHPHHATDRLLSDLRIRSRSPARWILSQIEWPHVWFVGIARID